MNYVGVGMRLVAQIIDMIVLMGIGYVLAIFTGDTTASGFSMQGPSALLFFAISFGYYIAMEAQLGGTVGKMALGLKVVKLDGSGPIGWVPSLIRNLLRIIDALPFFYIVGIILIWNSDKCQRLGDRVAETVVVKK
ncbi:MAG TPA: RDD family protein [Acidiferrobacteraceae bacterium]|nr:RDD family protein [Acidiferrobacteraceae bacterium]